MRLKDQVALITGGAQGIGRAIAETYAREGCKISICDVNEAAAQATADEIKRQFNVETFSTKVNVTVFEDCEKWVQATLDKLGRIDILVNNAGITKDNLVMRMTDAEWDSVVAVNLKGVFNCSKAVVRPLFKARKGRIINIASIVGLMGNAGQVNYSATKGGVIAMSKTCAREFASRNVLVNAIAPGFIRTAMTDKLSDEQKKALSSLIPLERLGEAQDVANAALFLATEESSYITGQVISVNGGMYM
ncbi:MAG: 3-oxoacyl-[acyl-carrier-protein] reductase [Elusimicrobiota bacterium]